MRNCNIKKLCGKDIFKFKHFMRLEEYNMQTSFHWMWFYVSHEWQWLNFVKEYY